MATYGPPSNCTPCNDAGVFACTNLPKSNPIKGGGTIPANTPSLISNYMVKQYDVANPSYIINGTKYWWRMGGGCVLSDAEKEHQRLVSQQMRTHQNMVESLMNLSQKSDAIGDYIYNKNKSNELHSSISNNLNNNFDVTDEKLKINNLNKLINKEVDNFNKAKRVSVKEGMTTTTSKPISQLDTALEFSRLFNNSTRYNFYLTILGTISLFLLYKTTKNILF